MTDTQIVDLILLHEGGTYTNDPADAGGPTKWGITIPVLSKHRGYVCDHTHIQAMSRTEAADIYRKLFVRPFDGLPDPLRVNVIDFGVNAGTYRAAVELQKIIGAGVDGKVGKQTKSLAVERDWNQLYVGARIAFYEGLILAKPTNMKWRNGWRRRALSFIETPSRRTVVRWKSKQCGEPIYGFMGKAE